MSAAAMVNRTARKMNGEEWSRPDLTTTKVAPQMREQKARDRSAWSLRGMGESVVYSSQPTGASQQLRKIELLTQAWWPESWAPELVGLLTLTGSSIDSRPMSIRRRVRGFL